MRVRVHDEVDVRTKRELRDRARLLLARRPKWRRVLSYLRSRLRRETGYAMRYSLETEVRACECALAELAKFADELLQEADGLPFRGFQEVVMNTGVGNG